MSRNHPTGTYSLSSNLILISLICCFLVSSLGIFPVGVHFDINGKYFNCLSLMCLLISFLIVLRRNDVFEQNAFNIFAHFFDDTIRFLDTGIFQVLLLKSLYQPTAVIFLLLQVSLNPHEDNAFNWASPLFYPRYHFQHHQCFWNNRDYYV